MADPCPNCGQPQIEIKGKYECPNHCVHLIEGCCEGQPMVPGKSYEIPPRKPERTPEP